MIDFPSPISGALWMQAQGFKVFPITPNQKTPAVKDFVKWATNCGKGSLETQALGGDFNYALVPALNGHVVLDVDVAKNDGNQTLLDLIEKHSPTQTLEETFTVRTPSGGLHYYFKAPDTRPTRNKLGLGLDTRGADSYVLAPGSRIDERPYEIENDSAPAECPEWLLSLINAEKEKPALERPVDLVLDNDEKIQDAINYLDNARPCVLGSEFSGEHLYVIFCELRDRGVTQEKAWDLFVDRYNDLCEPPWDLDNEDDLSHAESKLTNAYSYAKNTPGAKTAEAALKSAIADFTGIPLPLLVTEAVKKSASETIPLYDSADLDGTKIAPRDWVVKDMWVNGYVSVKAAPGGTGKTNIEILTAIAVVTGLDLLGDRYKVTKRGSVILFNGEDPLEEMQRRVEAFRIALELTPKQLHGLYLISGQDHPLTVASPSQTGEAQVNWKTVDLVVNTAKSINAVAISFDPLIELHEVNENDNGAVNRVMRAFKTIAKRTGCAISLVHHTNKGAIGKSNDDSDSQKHFRGAYSLIGAARVAHILKTMDEDEAERLAIAKERRRFYFKIELAKANLSAPAEFADWFEASGITIPNGEDVGVCKAVSLRSLKVVKQRKATEDAKNSMLEFLRVIVKNEDKAILDIIQEAEIKGQTWVDANHTRLREKMVGWLFCDPEFEVVSGNRSKLYVRRLTAPAELQAILE